MRSLYTAILFVMLGTLSVALLAFRSISGRMEKAYYNPVFDKFDQLEIESAQDALRMGGAPAVSAYMQKLDRLFGGSHYLLDEKGTDAATGVSRRALLPTAPITNSREQQGSEIVVTRRSEDGRYWFVAVSPLDRSHPWLFAPYYFLFAIVIAMLYWLAAVGLVSPIRRVSKIAEAFGRGELSVRVTDRRHDEIGDLAQSFNRMAERLERLITSERRLLQDVSHELRSPLARLKLATKLARTSPDQQSSLDRIDRDLDRMAALMGDILEITRMEGDSAPMETAPVDLDELLKEIVGESLIEAEMHGCRLDVTAVPGTEVQGSRELLRRAIENVLRNAIRYSPEQSVIDIALSEQDGVAWIEVRDRGPGVPEEMYEKLFEAFFRVEDARDTTRGGTGLGLSIAKRAILLHRGSISAVNASPGLKVLIALPLSLKQSS